MEKCRRDSGKFCLGRGLIMQKGKSLFNSNWNPSARYGIINAFYCILCMHIFLIIVSTSLRARIEGLFALLIYPIIVKIINWGTNLEIPVSLTIYERGIEIPSRKFFSFQLGKKLFIPYKKIEIIYPLYFLIRNNKIPIKKRKICFGGFNTILNNGRIYWILTEDFKKSEQMAPILKRAIGDSWEKIFNKHYIAKYLSEKEYKQISYLNQKGRYPPTTGNRFDITINFALAQLYEIETGNKLLSVHIGEVKEKYKDLWKNVEKIPKDFVWEEDRFI